MNVGREGAAAGGKGQGRRAPIAKAGPASAPARVGVDRTKVEQNLNKTYSETSRGLVL